MIKKKELIGDNMSEEDLNIYILAELKYKELHLNEVDIFPENWYSTKNYRLKTEIILDALTNNIRVVDTKLYKEKMIEGIRD